jgi:hypothetical protein
MKTGYRTETAALMDVFPCTSNCFGLLHSKHRIIRKKNILGMTHASQLGQYQWVFIVVYRLI